MIRVVATIATTILSNTWLSDADGGAAAAMPAAMMASIGATRYGKIAGACEGQDQTGNGRRDKRDVDSIRQMDGEIARENQGGQGDGCDHGQRPGQQPGICHGEPIQILVHKASLALYG